MEISEQQKNIWLTEQLNENSNINILFGTFVMPQILDIEVLKKSINKVIETNEALRIRMNLKDGRLEQYIENYEYVDVKTFIIDKDSTKKQKVIDLIQKEDMDLFKTKLYDFQIIQTKDETIVCIKMHHIISDAWSMMLVVEQIKESYNALNLAIEIENKPSYVEYIEKEREYKKSKRFENDKQFWNSYVNKFEYKKILEQPKDKSGKRIKKQIPQSLYEKIREYCKKNGISEYIFWITIISIYYSKLYDKKSMVIGTPFLNRSKSKKELKTIGMFVATLPICIEIEKKEKISELFKKVNRVNMSCFKHSKFPYEYIQEQYQTKHGDKSNLYEIAFSYQVNKLESKIDGNMGKTFWYYSGKQLMPLLISYVNHFEEHELYYDYIIQCFNENEINKLHGAILKIIEQILGSEDIEIKNIEILLDEDIIEIRKLNSKQIKEKTYTNIIERFEKVANKYKERIALKCGSKELSYEKLRNMANRLAEVLKDNNVSYKKPVVLLFDKSIEMIVSMLAVMKLGAYYIPILPQEDKQRMNYIIKDSNAKLVLTHMQYEDKIVDKEIKVIHVCENIFEHKNGDDYIGNGIKTDDICYMIYTSGTTGLPKGVMMKHENVISLVDSVNEDNELKFIENDVAISLLKYSFDASAIDIYTMLLNGGKLILIQKEIELDAEAVVQIMENEKVTRSFTVSKWIEQIADIDLEEHHNLENLRILSSGGDTLRPSKFKNILEKYQNLKIFNLYGPTETTMFVTKKRVDLECIVKNKISIGKPIPGCRIGIVNSYGNFMPINANGEILIYEDDTSFHNIAKGYWNLPEKTEERFIEIYNPITQKLCKGYKTGDIARINENLELEFLGRKDDFVKVNGAYLVSLNEVEYKIQHILGNELEICVVAVSFRDSKTLTLFVVNKNQGNRVKIDNIKSLIKDNITFYMNPKKIIKLNSMPLTNNGKIDRKRLEQIAINEIDGNKTEIIRPRDVIEQHLYNSVKQIVHEDFSIYDDFENDLGIDSLAMTVLYSKIANPNIQVQDLYNYSNIADLAILIKNMNYEEKYCNKENIQILNNAENIEMKNILLTGVTGFLGAHILRELVLNVQSIEKIYCIVRSKFNATSIERFNRNIEYYFDNNIAKKIKDKVIIIDGELTQKHIGLNSEKLKEIENNVDTIINSAANVRHLGKYDEFYRENVESVKNLLEIAKINKKSFIQISTLSLGGYAVGKTKVWNEESLNIGQDLHKNPYLISKLEAEKMVLQEINKRNINGKIFRVGNIMPRISDGKFQRNMNKNGFILSIRSLMDLRAKCSQMGKIDLFLTPADEASKAIVKLIQSKSNRNICHIETNKGIKLKNIIDVMQENKNFIQELDNKDFINLLNQKHDIGSNYLKLYFNSSKQLNIVDKTMTLEELKKNDYEWSSIDNSYLSYIVEIARHI